ncbi:transglycosylase SLT domain-containing protein [Rhodobacterales bacterium HKCCE2091]|nr:transglycosylase SLT domain-containing protein [Rhodobacterales bacterium HKCCE2091]
MRLLSFALMGAFLALSGCVMPGGASDELPVTRWDFRPDGAVWTAESLEMLEEGPAQPLTEMVPADVATWCPGYAGATTEERAAFWTGLLSALAQHESTWNPDAVGGGGQWFGLTQISPATARYYGCQAADGAALRDGPANLRCALRIWTTTVRRDGVIAAGGGGIAADWGPMATAAKREEMRAWVSAQTYCRA